MQNDTPTYFRLVGGDFLTAIYGDCESHAWLARYLKSLAYATLLENLDDLRNQIIAKCNSVKRREG